MPTLPKLACMELIFGDVAGDKFEPFLAAAHAAGYAGVALREQYLAPWYEQPDVFRALLKEHALELAGAYQLLTYDYVGLEKTCAFVAAQGCRDLIFYGGRAINDADRTHFFRAIEHLGGIAARHDLRASYHHHTHNFVETLTETERMLAETDPKRVHLFVDCGHCTKDFVELPRAERAPKFLEKNWARVSYIEFKDWSAETDLATVVGEGEAGWPAIFKIISERKYTGWVTVEQNAPSKGRTAAQCARASYEFITRNWPK